MAQAKQLFDSSSDIDSGMAHEINAICRCMQTADWQEGITAFAQKGRPIFCGL